MEASRPTVPLLQALAATLTYDERLKSGTEVFLQFALLYSTTDGHRRIRYAPFPFLPPPLPGGGGGV